jgi:uncharacterized protein YjiS (DUF1127 family)
MATLVHTTLTQFHLNPALTGLAERVGETLRTWQRRSRERRALADLSPYDLRDIGASPSDVLGELAKPFWRA